MAMKIFIKDDDFNYVVERLSEDVLNSAISIEKVNEIYEEYEGVKIALMVFDKYYMRAKNRVSLTLLVVGTGDNVKVTAISSGGGSGAIISFSWFSEESFVDSAAECLLRMGFKEEVSY